MKILCLCHTCRHQHTMDFDPVVGPGAGFSDWIVKHPQGHFTEFRSPQRSGKNVEPDNAWLQYLHNANVNVSYAAAAANTITLASLASSSSLLTGRQGTAVDNRTNKYLDYLISGKIKTGTTPTAGSIYVVVTATIDGGTSWPDAFTGADAAISVTTQGIFNAICKFAVNISMDSTTTGVTFPFPQTSVGQLFGGTFPTQFTPAVFHNTVAALDATGASHLVETQGVALTIV